ncbi:MAG TPA: translation elongation factor Ts [Casimicrobiaceae bacterium]|nr:translation elongation factor Ts [Casimicrobiaceae bacterium]
MAEVTASMVMDLRSRTGLPMMDCKKALIEAGGDPGKAEDLLRIKSGAKAMKTAGRVAAEGVIGLWVSPDAKTGAMVELNCETDFVARNDDFKAFAAEIAQVVARDNPSDVASLGERKLASGETIESRRVALVQKIGENMSIRRFVRREAKGTIASYAHGVKIGVLVDISGGDSPLGKDLAMHIAGTPTKPLAVDKTGVPSQIVDKEREIAAARAAESGKPADIVKKMVDGAVAKYLSDVTLLEQPFVKGDGKQTVGELLKSHGATVHGFSLYVVGQGVERKKDDFAAEVAAMAKTA